MAEPIYKLWMFRPKEAWYQLSKEERDSLTNKIMEDIEKVGGKSVLICTPTWSTEQWMAFGIEEYPDIEAVQSSQGFSLGETTSDILRAIACWEPSGHRYRLLLKEDRSTTNGQGEHHLLTLKHFLLERTFQGETRVKMDLELVRG